MKKFFLILLLLSLTTIACNSSILDDPSTPIDYSIPEPSHVKITIENSYNTVIGVLVDQDTNAGNYQFNFSMNNLLEGIYFYTLEAKGLNSSYYIKETRFLVLVK